MVEIVGTDEFALWYGALTLEEQLSVGRIVDLLGVRGISLGHPYSSAIEGASIALRELRIQHRGRPFRVFYAFDPKRQAVLLIGGDKTGQDDFYRYFVPLAERIWKQYLAEFQSTA